MSPALCIPPEPRIGRVAYEGKATTMQYIFYLVGEDGHVSRAAVVHELQNDHSAIKEANLAAGKNDVEIWEGARMVAYVVADETKQMPPPQKPVSQACRPAVPVTSPADQLAAAAVGGACCSATPPAMPTPTT